MERLPSYKAGGPSVRNQPRDPRSTNSRPGARPGLMDPRSSSGG